jgi:exodeoxyribonuclease V beta subunit
MVQLDPRTFPLNGLQLIEASAGTGKTYTITNLYLRLLLGHAPNNTTTVDALTVDKILVVTFTNAATEELRGRIRERIIEARKAFSSGKTSDAFISQLLEDVEDHQLAAYRLTSAFMSMDEAAIFTIHGYCQRMLSECAFETKGLFTMEFVLDDSEVQKEVIADFWRKIVRKYPAPLLPLIIKEWKDPSVLHQKIRSYGGREDITLLTPEVTDDCLLEKYDLLYGKITELKELWLKDNVSELIERSDIKANAKPKKQPRLDAVTRFAKSEDFDLTQPTTDKKEDPWEIWSEQNIQKQLKKSGKPFTHPVFSLFSSLVGVVDEFKKELIAHLYGTAIKEYQKQLRERKQEMQLYAPDDLLHQLAVAVKNNHGFSELLANKFPIALVDEFQDTDPLQFDIFSTIYGDEETPNKGLFMIGDPKQAIYAFRGADIFTYISARRRQDKNAIFNMGENWRSSNAVVSAINTLFCNTEAPFIYNEDIPFEPVVAANKNLQALTKRGKPFSNLSIWHYEEECSNKSEYQAIFAEKTAYEVSVLLNKNNNVCIGDTPVVAKDIAILVRDRTDAEAVQDALREACIESVYLSRESIFDSEESIDLYRILVAAAEPSNMRNIRAALATSFVGVDANELLQLADDDERIQSALSEFHTYNALWTTKGIEALVETLMQQRDLYSTNPNERRITNVRHLIELLQKKSQEFDGKRQLLQWYSDKLSKSGLVNTSDEDQLHLESDDNLVQIVTIHASKGLEYPITFVPFLSRPVKAKEYLYHETPAQINLDLLRRDESRERADKERLAEDARLLYVALTRAVHKCYLGVVNFESKDSNFSDSALGHILGDGDIKEKLTALASADSIEVEHFSETIAAEEFEGDDIEDSTPLTARVRTHAIAKHWRVTSYSALAKGAVTHELKVGLDDEQLSESAPPAEPKDSTTPSRYTFMKGARAGSLLHELLEKTVFLSDDRPYVQKTVRDTFSRFGITKDTETWEPILSDWITEIANAKLPFNGSNFSLSEISAENALVEMEFHFSLAKTNQADLNKVLSKFKSSPTADFANAEGVLKGFIDLIFSHKGKYFIVDYKSNHLGYEVSDYEAQKLLLVMRNHQYDLQYLLYTVALDRYLQQTVPDYSYEEHFGGVYYLFLRGAPEQGVFYDIPKPADINALSDLLVNV